MKPMARRANQRDCNRPAPSARRSPLQLHARENRFANVAMSERKFSFLTELKRRHVDKVALVYAVVSWLLFELAWILSPMFDAPEWMLPAVAVLLVLGFIITVIISWAFEMTPEGLKRTADATAVRERTFPR